MFYPQQKSYSFVLSNLRKEISFLVVSMDFRRSGTVTLAPNCRVKFTWVLSSFRLTSFLIDSIRTVVFTFTSMPITFFSKSVNVLCRGALRNFWTKFCLRLRWCLESCAAVVKFVSRSSSADVLLVVTQKGSYNTLNLQKGRSFNLDGFLEKKSQHKLRYYDTPLHR